MWMKLHKWMLVLSVPMLLVTLGGGSLMSGFGVAHSPGLGLLLVIPSFLAFFLLIGIQSIAVILHFTKYKTGISIKLVLVVLLFQFTHIFVAHFNDEYRHHPMIMLLAITDIIFFIFVVVYALKFFSSEKAKES